MNPSIEKPSTEAATDALDALLAGGADLGECIAAIRRLMATDTHLADTLRAQVEAARRDGSLSATHHARLTEAINESCSEDVPTEWSEEVALACVGDAVPDTAVDAGAGVCADGAPMPGSRLRDRFVLVARIGSGGMADIYKALDLRKQEAGVENPVVAVKILRSELRDQPAARQAFETEAALAASLAHPNIVRVFDGDRDGEHVFMTLELLEGRSLASVLNEQGQAPLEANAARRFAEGLAQGLVYAHAAGVVHADIKPGNVFVTDSGQIKLIDFGCAQAATDPGSAAVSLSSGGGHTPAYASCEVLEGLVATPQDDLYSLACVIHRMLCGRRPWGAASALEAEQSARELIRARGIADHEWLALRAALAFRRADRPESVAAFLEQFLGESLNTEAPAAPANKLSQTVEPSARRRRRPLGLAAITTLLAVGIAVSVLAPTSEPPAPELASTARQLDGSPVATEAAPLTLRTPGAIGPPVSLVESVHATRMIPPRSPRRRTDSDLEEVRLPESVKRRPAPVGEPAAMVAASRLSADAPLIAAPDLRARYLQSVPDDSAAVTRLPDAPASDSERLSANFAADPAKEPTDGLLLAFNGSAARAAASLGAAADSAATDAVDGPVAAIPFARPLTSGSLPGAVADVPVASAGPAQRPLSDLEFERYVEPRFPRRASRAQASGWVVVQFRVDRQGAVAEVEIIDADPPLFFDQAAISAVEKWRFKPLIEHGEAVESLSKVRLRFQPE